MSFEEGREEFIREGLKKKRVDELSMAATLLTGPAIAMTYPTVTYMVGIIGLILVFHMVRLSRQIFDGRESFISLAYVCMCVPATLLNFYLGMILMLLGYGKFSRTYRKKTGLSDRFIEAQEDARYAGMILGMIVCIILMLIYSFKIIPPTLERM